MSINLYLFKSPKLDVLTINEHGYIRISSEINAEKRAASHDSIKKGYVFIHWAMPEIQQLSNPIFICLNSEARLKKVFIFN